MGTSAISSGAVDIAISGLRAQRMRLDVIANNIANINTRRTKSGEPYRRREVILGVAGGDKMLAGVRIVNIAKDLSTAFKRVRDPNDPLADKDGFVQMSNVDLPREMAQMVVASRAYQANAAVLKRYQESVNITLELLR